MTYKFILIFTIFLFANKANALFSQAYDSYFNFLNKLWYHQKAEKDFNKYLSPFAFVVDKKNAKSYLYFYNGDTKLVKTYDILTGKEFGQKMIEGDNKTPEGIYFFEKFISGSYLRNQLGEAGLMYGSLAVPMNYPNPIDKIEKRDGNGIWLHGTISDDRVKLKFDTEGCVAGANIDIENMIEFIQTKTTPMIIFSEFKEDPNTYSLSTPKELSDFIEKWRNSWESKDLESYLETYSENYYDIEHNRDKKTLSEYKALLNNKYSNIHVSLENISSYRHTNYWVVQFIQRYSAPGYFSSGIKRLYITENLNLQNKYSIVSEEFVGINNIVYLGNKLKKKSNNNLSSL